ncbi:RluA family pseudouridine synthase [Candidatus Dependentiae bacterium]|nr:RluA family pseudouridine synthase [Candidatus Dependentiae bacterium]
MGTKLLIKPNISYELIVEPHEAAMRLDMFLVSRFPDLSRNFFQRLVEANCVQINKQPAAKQGVKIKLNDQVSITVPAQKKRDPQALTDSISVEVVYEHEHFLIINKPAGVNVHPPRPQHEEPSLVDWLLNHYASIAEVGYNDRPGIVHRLDKDTSGIMVVARTAYAHAYFERQFRLRTIKKTYLAITQGHPNQSGTIDLMIGRHPTSRCKMMHVRPEKVEIQRDVTTGYLQVAGVGRVRQAVSHYRVLEYFERTALIEVHPVTGRTHQIRVHCAGIGHPLIGDFLYGTTTPLIARQALHAASLTFVFDGKEYEFNADLPSDFLKLLNQLRMKG